ncbi:hypothetical protein HPB47_012314, partial [Ixodes persulcatus]
MSYSTTKNCGGESATRALPQLIKSGAGRCAGGLVVLVTASNLPGGHGAPWRWGTWHTADSRPSHWAREGRSFALPTANELHSAKIDDALAAAASQLTPKHKRDITVRRQEILVQTEKRVQVLLDRHLGIRTRFIIIGPAVRNLTVRLNDPEGNQYQESSPECTKDVATTHWIIFAFPSTKPGKWTVQFAPMTPGTKAAITLLVVSRQSAEPGDPVALDTYLSGSVVAHPEVPSVHVRVRKGYSVVLGASVSALVTRPAGRPVSLHLYDNGVGWQDLIWVHRLGHLMPRSARMGNPRSRPSWGCTTLLGGRCSSTAVDEDAKGGPEEIGGGAAGGCGGFFRSVNGGLTLNGGATLNGAGGCGCLVGSDTTESDGIYSAFFTDHTGPGRYQVAVRATGRQLGQDRDSPGRPQQLLRTRTSAPTRFLVWLSSTGLVVGVFRLDQMGRATRSFVGKMRVNLSVPFKRAYQMSELAVDSRRFRASAARVRSEPCGAFERHALVGAFQLTGYGERTGTAPGVVQDLQVQDSFFRGSRWMVQLSWTEMGAYGDASTVGTVDVRCSQYANQLEESFEEAIKIQKADLLRGSLSPQAPNKKHELLIQ